MDTVHSASTKSVCSDCEILRSVEDDNQQLPIRAKCIAASKSHHKSHHFVKTFTLPRRSLKQTVIVSDAILSTAIDLGHAEDLNGIAAHKK